MRRIDREIKPLFICDNRHFSPVCKTTAEYMTDSNIKQMDWIHSQISDEECCVMVELIVDTTSEGNKYTQDKVYNEQTSPVFPLRTIR